MRLASALGPISLEVLREKYWGRKSLLLVPQGGVNPLEGLVTLEELEVRLNDGCASMTNLAVIGPDGGKLPRERLYHRQVGPCWTPEFLRKREVAQHLANGASFVLHNMTHVNPRVAQLISDIETEFPDFAADAHLYVSPRPGATGYRVHKDEPQHKLYFQVFGSTQWTVYKGQHAQRALSADEARTHLTVDFEAELPPGSVLYMPPGVFHKATNPTGPRLSLSVPIAPRLGAQAVDRHHIPLVRLMTAQVGGV
ncbi:MAG TPA: cupin domain-containing protein [Polyangiaceae bacterium]|nr:cupin domain-containing protein [Polyangiaceae bacterium]